MKLNNQQVSVVIPTRNRKDELRVAIQSILKQTVQPEIIVLDDASTDGTSEMMRNEVSMVQLVRSEQSLGAWTQRNIGTKLSNHSIVISVDDDTEFVNPTIIEQTLKLFDHPRVAVVTIPFVNINSSPKIIQQAPNNAGIYVTNTFIGLGFAFRKDIYNKFNGFRDNLWMGGGESDLSIRMLEKGYVVRLGNAEPIHHFYSPKRESDLRFQIKCRNHILLPWLNAPTLTLPFHLIGTIFNNLRFGWQTGRFFLSLKGLAIGFRSIFSEWSSREPVSIKTYRLFRKLRKRGPMKLQDIENILPHL